MAKRDGPRCNHKCSEVIVTNQPGKYDNTRAYASVWVCSDPGCVIDAMAWVGRFTKEKAWRRTGVDGEWDDTKPEAA